MYFIIVTKGIMKRNLIKRFLFLPLIIFTVTILFCSCITLEAGRESTTQENTIQEEENTVAEENSSPGNADTSGQEDYKEGFPDNIMFQSSQAVFAFVYPHDDLAIYSYLGRDPEYGGLSLNVSVNDLKSLQGTIKEYALEEEDALKSGDYGPDNDFSYPPSRNVIKVGDVFVKEYTVFSRYDACAVTFERNAVFYNKGYQVKISLAADRDEVIGEMEEYFTTDEINCLGEKVWAEGGKEAFSNALGSGETGPLGNKWQGVFDDMMNLLQINDFKGASAGYSRINDQRYFEANPEEKYIIDIAYPGFQSAYTGGLEDSINPAIYDDYIAPTTSDFKDEVLSYDYEDENITYFLAVDYEVISFDEHIISVCLNINPYMGGAHGMQYFKTINYSIDENRILKLSDLFEPGYDHMKKISVYCSMDLICQMHERGFMPDEEWIEDGTDPSYTDTFTNWLISPRGLIVKFPAYQVGPYAAGDFTVVIPYGELEGFRSIY